MTPRQIIAYNTQNQNNTASRKTRPEHVRDTTYHLLEATAYNFYCDRL